MDLSEVVDMRTVLRDDCDRACGEGRVGSMSQQTTLDFDCLTFKPMTLAQWKTRYRGAIRIQCSLKRITKATVTLTLADKQTTFHLVHYEKGDWRDGVPKTARIGMTPMLVRLPAIQVGKNQYLLLDGNHRIQAGPAFVVLDVLVVPLLERKYITDLYNPRWSK